MASSHERGALPTYFGLAGFSDFDLAAFSAPVDARRAAFGLLRGLLPGFAKLSDLLSETCMAAIAAKRCRWAVSPVSCGAIDPQDEVDGPAGRGSEGISEGGGESDRAGPPKGAPASLE